MKKKILSALLAAALCLGLLAGCGGKPEAPSGILTEEGAAADAHGISLTGGAVELRIRLSDPVSGTVSSLMTESYNIKLPFDSISNLVDQDSYYEYCVSVLGLMRYNLQTGARECIYETGTQSITNLCVTNELTTKALAQGEDYGASILLPEARLQWEEHKERMTRWKAHKSALTCANPCHPPLRRSLRRR
jgi:hypothetical protein